MFDEHEPAEFKIAADLSALSAVERQLARLTPAAPSIDRDRLMFEAGRAAAQPRRLGYIAGPFRAGARFWPAATATMTAATLLLSVLLLRQQIGLQQNTTPIAAAPAPDQTRVASTHHTPRPEMTMTGWTTIRPPKSGYLGVRYIALTQGVGALEPQAPATGHDRDSSRDLKRTQRDMLNELLPPSHREINPRS